MIKTFAPNQESATDGQATPLLNLVRINNALLAFEASKVKSGLHVEKRIQRLMSAYAMLDEVLKQGVDLFGCSSSMLVLKLNHTVLFGCSTNVTRQHRCALDASEARFYNGYESTAVNGVTGGFADLMWWYASHRYLGPSERAAGVMIRALMSPQLFFKGNHRTSVLLASFILVKAGKPPLVFDAVHAQEFLNVLGQASTLSRGSLVLWARERRLRQRLAQLIVRSSNKQYLLD